MPSMDDVELIERLVRIESGLESVKTSIEFGDRSSAQLVQLLAARVDSLSNDITRTANLAREADASLQRRLDAHSEQLDVLTVWKAKVAGMALAVGAIAGGTAGAVFRLIGHV